MNTPISNTPAGEPVVRLRSRAVDLSRRQPPLSLRERYVLWAAIPVILLNPWHAGSMLWWSNLANFGMALLPLIVAFVPLRSQYPDPSPSFTSGQVFKNLLKFPIFWLGLLFFAYIAIQGFNYSWEFVWTEGRRGFYMQKLPDDQYIHWLPSGMNSPFKWTNPWQALLMWATPWLVVCAMWGSFKRAKSWRIVLWQLATVGALLGLLGIFAKITAPDKIFWIWDNNNLDPFGPFTYRNQASVFLYMAMASAFSLFLYYQRAQVRDSGIQWLAMLLAVTSLAGSAMSFSRAGWIGTGAVLLAAVLLFFIRLLWQRDHNWKLLLIQLLLFVSILTGIGFLVSQANFKPIIWKWERTFKVSDGEIRLDSGILVRKKVADKTIQMFLDNRAFGWGAGSYRYYFPVYQQEDESITHPRGRQHKRYFWTNAHSDWAQILAEYGIVGSSFLLLGLLYWCGSILLRLRSLHCEHWMLLFAVVTMICHSVLDIVFYNPSLVIVFSLVLASARGMLIRPLARDVNGAG